MDINFERYMPDGPGYTGRVRLSVDGSVVQLRIDAKEPVGKGKVRRYVDVLEGNLPAMVRADVAGEERRQALWDAMGREERDHFTDAESIDPDRLRWVWFEDGTEGAVLLGGDVCIVSVYQFKPDGLAAQHVEFSSNGETVVAEWDSSSREDLVGERLDELAALGKAWERVRVQGLRGGPLRAAMLRVAAEAVKLSA